MKSELVEDAFRRVGRLSVGPLAAARPSPESGYRLRARLHVRNGRAGFYREGTHVLCRAAPTGQLLPETTDAIDRLVSALSPRDRDCDAIAVTENVAATQRVAIRRFVPLDSSMLEQAQDGPSADYEFEPNPQEILDRLLPRYAEARLYAALLEGSASFFAAQQRAMKSATDNADELIKSLSVTMNRARQDSITTEIMEIVGGAEALGSDTKQQDLRIIEFEFESASRGDAQQ